VQAITGQIEPKPICEILPARPPQFTGAELAKLLGSLPKPDSEYLAILEDLVAKQPLVAESGWHDRADPDPIGLSAKARVGSDLPYGAWVSGEFAVGGQQCYPLDRSLGHEDAIEWVFVSGWQVINVDRMFARDR